MILLSFILSCTMILTKAECLAEWIPLQTLTEDQIEAENDNTEMALESAQEGSGEAKGSDEGGNMRLWGVCRVTHYCPCSECCGQWAGGSTASGTAPTVGRTVAADLPFGTRLMINGEEYVVEDRGVSGMWVDIFVGSHDEALARGMYQAEVYIIEG